MNIYLGVVTDNDDPDMIGRVKVRIPELDGVGGSSVYTEDDELNWFETCSPFFGGYQYGSFVVPAVGAIVWCLIDQFDDSSEPYRLVIGGGFNAGNKYKKELGGKSVPKNKLETPKEATSDYPNNSVIFKSLSGASIYFDGEGSILIKNDNISIELDDNSILLDANNKASIEIRDDGKIYVKGSVINL